MYCTTSHMQSMPLIRPSKSITRPFRFPNFALPTPQSLYRPNLLLSCSLHPKSRRMGSIASADVVLGATPPFRILVAGGSYAGLSAALNLLDLCGRRAPRCGEPTKLDESNPVPDISIDITIVDERDGFCKLDPSRFNHPRCIGRNQKGKTRLGIPLT